MTQVRHKADPPAEAVSNRGRLDPDALAALEEQRDFLLRSLDDLEREHAAGDVDEHDYAALKDDYTARAATVLRAIDAGRARFAAARRPRSWRRTALVGGAVLAVAVLAGVLVARSSGDRSPGQTITGGVTATSRDQVAEAQQLFSQGKALDAIKLLDRVLQRSPDNVDALTYRGWFLSLAGLNAQALPYLNRASTVDPTYAPAHVFTAVVLKNLHRYQDALDALNQVKGQPPASVAPLIASLRQQLQAQVSG